MRPSPHNPVSTAISLAALLLAVALLPAPAPSQTRIYEEAPLHYSESEARDPIAGLRARYERGELTFPAGGDEAFLRDFLRELAVPVESQVLVFSKTSKQNSRISPQTPRAIYFSEEFYVGWVPDGMIEVGSIDPRLGPVFNLIDHRNREEAGIRFERPQDCLDCHGGSRTRDHPGFLIRSVYPDDAGMPILSEGSFITGHESPLSQRWGGWYVTGRHGDQRHMGNVVASILDEGIFLDTEAGANITSLEHLFATDPYPVPRSDILALMVLEHQVEMHNRLHRAAASLNRVLHLQNSVATALGEQPSRELTGSALSVAEGETERILEYLLFCEETPLEDGGIEDAGRFREAFLQNRRESPDGRFLKDFQLFDRLFKYRCSYMIYSQSFDSLPPPLKASLYRRLWNILRGKDPDPKFHHLSESERARIAEVLIATKEGLPSYWKL